jgi:hypothetical protein
MGCMKPPHLPVIRTGRRWYVYERVYGHVPKSDAQTVQICSDGGSCARMTVNLLRTDIWRTELFSCVERFVCECADQNACPLVHMHAEA